MLSFLKKPISKEQIAKILQTTPEALAAFEEAYQKQVLTEPVSDNLFEINAKQAAEMHVDVLSGDYPELHDMILRIVNELIAQTLIWEFDGKTGRTKEALFEVSKPVTLEEIKKLPPELQPQLTGNYMKKDISEPSYPILLEMYQHFLTEKNPQKRKGFYDRFRQGLDILDLDPVTYEMIGTNPNSIGYWLPNITKAVVKQGFFKIPKTTIIKVPLPLLQLTRQPYEELTQTTRDIVNKFCQKVFSLDINKEYFLKTGTYSSKFDFRNAHVWSPHEVLEIGEYLLFIHFQALMMASPLNNRCIYGVSTTNEWVVREFIPDIESNPTIYKGLPLRTEYRVFVDFDTQDVIGINPYWDPDVMRKRFTQDAKDNIHDRHDYFTYQCNEETLMKRYNDNKETIMSKVKALLPNIDNLSGQWSIDVMQNGNDFWIIDMHLAQNSAYYTECVPENLRTPLEENWIPKIEVK